MKKSKIIVLILTIALVVGMTCFVTVPASAAINEEDWIAAPGNTLVKCPGGTCDHENCDYVYSFAVIGDTQNLNYTDAENYVAALAEDPTLTYEKYTSAYMRTLYNWILANKASKNIEYVLGLGDITQSFNTSQTYYDEEWPLAKEAIKLLDGEIGYSLVRGNHDISSGMNANFGIGTEYYNTLVGLASKTDDNGRPMAGFLDTDKVEDTYRKIVTSNGDKYIIFTLDYYPTEECVDWLNDILAENSDYTAIITLHAFLNTDRTFIDDFETTTPADSAADPSWNQIATGGNVSPRTLWEEALSKHANVKFVFSGHVTGYGYNNQLIGDNGNIVTCMLMDAQDLDNSAPIGMITMVYVSADGSVVNVENFSPVRLAEGKNAYFNDENQFELKVDYSEGWTSTKYGDIPSDIYNNTSYGFHVFIDDNDNADDTNFYWGSYATWDDTLSNLHKWNGKGGASARAKKTYNIIMTGDYTHSSGLAPNASGSFPGKFNLDLNGKTLTLTSNGVPVPYYTSTSYTTPAFTVQNGNVVMSGNSSSHIVALNGGKSNGAIYTLNFDKLNITYNNSTSTLVDMYSGYDGYKSNVNLNVTDCTVDTTSAGGAVTLFNFSETYNNIDVALNISGGSIKGTTAANLTMYKLNSGDDTAKFSPDASGNYTTVSFNENAAPVGIFRNEEGKLLTFVTESQEAPYVFAPEIAPIEDSAYGDIPTDVYPASSYPFVLFQNGEIVDAYATWYDFCQNIYAFDTKAENETVLYLRGSITVDKTSNQLRNVKNLTIDLGGNTLTSAAILFNYIAEKNYDFTTDINVKNGTLTAAKAWAPIIAYNSANTSDVECCFNMVFDGVTFNATSDFSGRLLAEAWKDGTYGTKNSITLNDCTFDATVGTVSKLFQLEESNSQNKVDVAININGGKLIANSYFTLGTFSAERETGKGSPDTLTLGKGSDGNEFALVMPSTVAHPTTGIKTTSGTLNPIEMIDDGTNATYYFKNIVTDYGTISSSKLSAVDYPLVLFQNGAFKAAYATWSEFVTNASVVSVDSVILLRRDYTTANDSYSKSQNQRNLNKMKADLTVDLGGYKFTRSSTFANHFIQAYGIDGTDEVTYNIAVRNGYMHAEERFIYFNNLYGVNDGPSVETFNITFDNVEFTVKSGFNKGFVTAGGDGNGSYGNIVFNNCVFNLAGISLTSTVFVLADADKNVDISVIINGGRILSNSFDNLILATFDDEREAGKGSPDSLKFGTYNGNYVSFVTKSGNSAPSYNFVTVNGSQVSLADVSTSDNAIYQLGEDIETDYGYIPYAYRDVEKYPIIIFKNGTYHENNTVFSAAYIAAVGQTGDSADTVVVVLLRKSLTEKLSTSLSNADTIKGTLIIDLDGNTYETSAKALFQFNAKNSTNNPKIELRNGRINTVRLIAFANQTTEKCQNYDILFKNVTLGFTSGTWNDMASTNKTAASDGYYAHANLTFEDCIFDLRANQTFTSYRLLDLANDTNNHAVDVIFRGGEFLLDDYTFTLASIKSGYSDNTYAPEGANDSDTVKFEKGANGYTVFRLPSGATAPTNVYNSTELTFVKVADDGTEAIYNLMPAAAVNLDFKPKMSITLGSELVYNIYVPVADYLKSFTVDGNTVECKEIFTLDDGNSYYRIEVSLPAKEAARNIILKATVTVDGKDYTGSWTVSIPEYAEKLLNDSQVTETEKTLVLDVLQYIRAAYAYFGTTDAEQIAKINTLLGEYASKPTVEGSATAETTGMKSATLVLSGEPSIRFYLADGADASAYKFFIDGKQVNTIVSDDGSYVDIDVYAYALSETVTYTVDGENAGSFHINAYYAFVSGTGENSYAGEDKEALTALTECFWKYLQSARAYRASVIEE